jgi:WD40 repeat protein
VTADHFDVEEACEVYCVKFDDTDKYVAASYSDGTIKVFNTITGKMVQRISNNFNIIEDTKMSINCFKFRPTPTSLS